MRGLVWFFRRRHNRELRRRIGRYGYRGARVPVAGARPL